MDPIPNNSKIKVRFPPTIALVHGSCQLQSVTEPFNLAASCVIQLNTVIITYPFLPGRSYDPQTMGAIRFSFNTGGTNPTVGCDAGPFMFSSFAIFDGLDYAIDYYHFHSVDDKLPRFAPFIPIADSLKVEMMEPSSYMTYNAPTTYIFKIFPRLQIPQYSKMLIVFPPQLHLQPGLTQIICRTTLPSGPVISYTTPDIYEPVTFTIQNLFSAGPYTQTNEAFNLQCEGIQNPKTLDPTDSFTIATFDKNGCGIERLNRGLIIQMFGLPSFQEVNITSDVPYNGLLSTISLEFTPLISFSDNYTIYITFPPEIRIPQFPECLPHLLTSKAVCTTLPENKMKARLTFISPPALPYSKFGFKLDKIMN